MGSLALQLARRGGTADGAAVRRMLDAAPHRGERRSVVTLGAVALGVAARDGEADLAREADLAVALVGRIDEVGAARGAPGAAPHDAGAGDLLRQVRRLGPAAAVAGLRGSFSAVVTDGRTVWCLRDPFGTVPLHHDDGPGDLLVATEAKQVVAGSQRSLEPDVDGLRDQFYGRLESGTTAVQGVRRVPRATVTTAAVDRPLASARYWHPRELLETADVDLDTAREQFVALLDRAVRRCMRGDDALSLSGGLDSTAIAAFAAPHHREVTGRPLTAVSAVYPDHPEVDERPWIELVSEALGLDLHTHVLTTGPLQGIEDWVDVFDGPVTTVSVPEMAEEYAGLTRLGPRTLLTGELAEYAYGIQRHLLGHFALHGRLGPLTAHVRYLRDRGRPGPRILREILATATPTPIARRWVHARRAELYHLPPWVSADPLGDLGYRDDLRHRPRDRWRELQVAALANDSDSLEADETCASVFGLTIRRPFLDIDLWEFLLSLPAEVKHPDPKSKTFAREAMRGRLPDAILDRRRNTIFNDHYQAIADTSLVERIVLGSPHRLDWIDYDLLRDRLRGGDMDVFELKWAHDAAWVHAFLDRW